MMNILRSFIAVGAINSSVPSAPYNSRGTSVTPQAPSPLQATLSAVTQAPSQISEMRPDTEYVYADDTQAYSEQFIPNQVPPGPRNLSLSHMLSRITPVSLTNSSHGMGVVARDGHRGIAQPSYSPPNKTLRPTVKDEVYDREDSEPIASNNPQEFEAALQGQALLLHNFLKENHQFLQHEGWVSFINPAHLNQP